MTNMIQEKISVYESPQVEIIEIYMEQVLAASYGTNDLSEEEGQWM